MIAPLLRIAHLALLSVLTITAAESAAAQDKIHVCFNEWPPFSMLVDDEPTGISVEILTAASHKAGLEIEFSELPWNRCLEQVRTGKIDAVIDAARRAEFIQGPTSYSYYSNTIWVKNSSAVQRYSPAAFSGLKIGLVHGYEYPETLLHDLEEAGADFERSVDDPTNIRKLAFGRIDAVVADMASTLLFVREHGLSLRPLRPTHSADPLFVSFNRQSKEAHDRIDRALAKLKKDGLVDAVYQRYLGVNLCAIAAPDQKSACSSHQRP